MLTLEDVSLLTGLSKSYLYRLTCTHQIPYYKPNGKQIYFDRAEIESWMKQNRVATQQEAEQAAIAYVVTGKQKGGGLGISLTYAIMPVWMIAPTERHLNT